MQNTQFETPSTTWSGLGRLLEGPVGWLVTLILIGVLLAAALLLPPVNLLERLGGLAATRISAGIGGSVRESDGTLLNFPGEGVQSAFSASLESTPRADFIEGRGGQDIYTAASTLPNFLVPKSPLYHVSVSGQAPDTTIVSIPIPNDSLPYETLDLYMWTGQNWEHLPNSVLPTEDVVEARLNFVPAYFMIMQTSGAGNIPEATASLEFNSQLPQGAVVANEMVSGLRLRGDGALDGDAPYNNDGRTIPIIRNWEGDSWAPTVRTDLINNLLIDIGQQDNQLNAVEQTILLNSYPGVVIDYRGVDALPSAKADFVHLMNRLADRLHASGKKLYVRVEAPSPISAESWDTGGHDWRALGAVADTIIVPAPIDPMAYQPNGAMDALLKFAAGEIDRRKIQIELPGQSIERAGQYLLPKGYQQAFQPLLQKIDAQNGGDSELILTLQNPNIQGQVAFDSTLGMYTYSYEDAQNLTRTVYIESASSIANKLNLLAGYNIRKVTLDTPANSDVDPMIWDVLLKFQQGQEINVEQSKLDVVYSLYNQAGALVAQQLSPIESPTVAMASPGGENLQVEATIVDNGRAVAPALSHTIGAAVAAAKAATTGEVQVQAADVATADDAAVAVEVAEVGPSGPAANVSQILNVREGPGTVYNILGQINPGNSFPIAGKNEVGDWWQIEYAPGQTGWVFGQLVDTTGDVNAVALAADIPEAPVVAAPEPVAEAAPAGQAAPPPVVSAPVSGGGPGFGYGVQAHMVDANNEGQVMGLTQNLGFGWIKQQIEWKRFENTQGAIEFGGMDSIVNAANGAGISLLFSVVNAPGWAREGGFDNSVGGPPADPGTYASFVGAVAGKYCNSALKGIEVWNEQNLHYEWGNKPLNAGEYVNLLAAAYNSIKGACPNMTVISGALTPAGNNGSLAMDDFTYLEQMFQAGANNYLDAVGAHPSGYNVPPQYTWQEACDAIQITGNSFNGACDSPHHSWSFRSTMEGYKNIMNVYGAGGKRIWPTEFGWAAGGAFNPNYQYANDNDFTEQAEWTVQAYQMMKQWGWVGPAFLWNLNFRMVADGTEKAQWGIVDNGGGPLPVYNALQAMGK